MWSDGMESIVKLNLAFGNVPHMGILPIVEHKLTVIVNLT
jgi:hypothetical protein